MNDRTTQETVPAVAEMTTDIVASYVRHNKVSAEELPNIIRTIAGALSDLGKEPATETEKPAVPVKKSVTPDYIVCLEDGKKLKMLKRYLRTNYNMSPEEYRAKWNLPSDYPMVAPNYSKKRSQHAKKIGLGKRGTQSRREVKAA